MANLFERLAQTGEQRDESMEVDEEVKFSGSEGKEKPEAEGDQADEELAAPPDRRECEGSLTVAHEG